MEDLTISLYIINLQKRLDRRFHIEKEFEGRSEFDLHLIEAVEDKVGAVGLWKSIVHIIQDAVQQDDDVIVICEDDHVFTEHYDRARFMKTVIKANALSADLLIGGVSGGFSSIAFVAEGLAWIDNFWGTQFVVVYKRFFPEILKAIFHDTDVADQMLSSLTANKLLFYPPISRQKEIGSSDISPINSVKGRVDFLFKNAEAQLQKLYHKHKTLVTMSDQNRQYQ